MKFGTVSKLGTSAVALAALTLPAVPALATSNPAPEHETCTVTALGTKTSSTQSTQFVVNGDEIVARFKLTDPDGDNDCRATVTIATWKAPNGTDGRPLTSQTLFKSQTGTFGPGEHLIATDLPHCFWQADLVRGSKPDVNGTPVYTGGMLVSSMHGGKDKCEAPKPSPSPSPSPSPAPSVSPSPTPVPGQVLGTSATTLPDTGAVGGVIGLGSMLTAGYAYWRSRRNLRG